MLRRYRGTTAQLDANAIELRRKQTPTELELWQSLRNRQVGGLKFRRQHPVGPFVLDFYCAEHRLAVELDGSSHDEKEEYDLHRTGWLEANGIRVMRFRNEDVVNRIEWVIEEILKALTPDPSPAAGRGENEGED